MIQHARSIVHSLVNLLSGVTLPGYSAGGRVAMEIDQRSGMTLKGGMSC